MSTVATSCALDILLKQEQMYALVAAAVYPWRRVGGGAIEACVGCWGRAGGALRGCRRRHGADGPGRRVRVRRALLLSCPKFCHPRASRRVRRGAEGACQLLEEACSSQPSSSSAGVYRSSGARFYLKLYTTISVGKLAGLMEVEAGALRRSSGC